MNQLLLMPNKSSIDACLRRSAPDVRQVDDRCWQLALENGTPLRVSATMDEGFLLFDAPASAPCQLQQAPQWLRWNARLAGEAKLALTPRPWRLRLRAELPVDYDADMATRIAATLDGLHEACALLANSDASAGAVLASRAALEPGESGHSAEDLYALLRETGWPFQERTPELAAVELPTRGDSSRVLVEATDAGLRAGVELLQVDVPDPPSRLAMATLLLSASGSVRLARPYAAGTGDQFVCGFEVRLAGGHDCQRTRTRAGGARRRLLGVQAGGTQPARQVGG